MKKIISISILFSLSSFICAAQETLIAKEDIYVNKDTYSSGSTGNNKGNLILFGDGSNGGGWQSSIKWSGIDGFNSSISSGSRINAEITVGNVGSYGKSDLIFRTKGTNDNATPTEKLRITSTGNIGIGTSNPSYLLDVVSSKNDYLQFRVKSPGSPLIKLSGGYNGGNGAEFWQDEQGNLRFNVNSTTNGLLIKQNGNIGVGTSAPDQKLVVNGNISFAYNSTLSANGFRRNGIKTEYYNVITGVNSNVIHEFTGTNTTIMSLTQGGNVGIGTTNPDAKLAVKGRIHTQEVKVDLNGAVAPDYVFLEDYDLKTIKEVENYIEKEGHLPNIPSAKEMEQNGIELKTMNLKLLEKIEELTLYMIEQNKKTELLRQEIVLLKEKNKELEEKIK